MRAREFIFESKKTTVQEGWLDAVAGVSILGIAAAALELFCFEEFGVGAEVVAQDYIHQIQDALGMSSNLQNIPTATPYVDNAAGELDIQPAPASAPEAPPGPFIPNITGDHHLDDTLYHAARGEDQDFSTKSAQWVSNLLHNDQARPLFEAAHNANIKGKELLAFIAQCATETWDFTRFDEAGDASHLNRKYANINGNSDENSGDGYRYRGRGYIQLTGKGNYQAASHALYGDDRLVDDPDRAAEPTIAAKIATWFWEHRVHGRVSNYDDTRAVTHAIQGGTGDLRARRERFNLLKKFAELGNHITAMLHKHHPDDHEVYVDNDNTVSGDNTTR